MRDVEEIGMVAASALDEDDMSILDVAFGFSTRTS